jgi:hypothetical protein
MNGLVTLRKRPFDLDFYTAVVVRADASAVEAAHVLAREHVQAQTSFGVTGKRTFCRSFDKYQSCSALLQ